MNKSTFFSFIFIFSISYCNSQVQAITSKGDTIIVSDNGTWKKMNRKTSVAAISSNVKTTVKVDEFDSTKRITTDKWTYFGVNDVKEKISGYLVDVGKLVAFSITYTGDLGCLSKYSTTMKVKLSNGKVVHFSQISDTECGSGETARFIPLSKDELKDSSLKDILENNMTLLRDFDWVTIRINGSKYYTDIKPNQTKKVTNPEQFFRQHIIASENAK